MAKCAEEGQKNLVMAAVDISIEKRAHDDKVALELAAACSRVRKDGTRSE